MTSSEHLYRSSYLLVYDGRESIRYIKELFAFSLFTMGNLTKGQRASSVSFHLFSCCRLPFALQVNL
jgi:hypothetical protein